MQCGCGGKVIASLVGHTKRVNSVKWLSKTELVSGSSDNTAIVWRLKNGAYAPFVLQHESNVNLVDGICKSDGVVVVTVGMECTIKVWFRASTSGIVSIFYTILYLICLF